jgi:hypothetical protein
VIKHLQLVVALDGRRDRRDDLVDRTPIDGRDAGAEQIAVSARDALDPGPLIVDRDPQRQLVEAHLGKRGRGRRGVSLVELDARSQRQGEPRVSVSDLGHDRRQRDHGLVLLELG